MDKKDLIKQCRYYKGEEQNPYEVELERYEVDKSHLPPPECMKTEYRGITEREIQRLQYSYIFWEYERYWVKFSLDNEMTSYLNEISSEYKINVLKYFDNKDNVPLSLKAVLFNRYAHWHSGYGNILEDFQSWYSHY